MVRVNNSKTLCLCFRLCSSVYLPPPRITQSLETLIQNIPLFEPDSKIEIRTDNLAITTICPSNNGGNEPYTVVFSSNQNKSNISTLEKATLILERGYVKDTDGKHLSDTLLFVMAMCHTEKQYVTESFCRHSGSFSFW